MEFAERLKYEREQRNLSQQDIAKNLHISRQTLSKWELGKSYSDLEMILLLSKFYGFTLDELVNEDRPTKDNLRELLNTVLHMNKDDLIEWIILGIGSILIICILFFLISDSIYMLVFINGLGRKIKFDRKEIKFTTNN